MNEDYLVQYGTGTRPRDGAICTRTVPGTQNTTLSLGVST